MTLQNYFVVYPTSGLSDMLCVIDRCLEYAVKQNRLLIIDTEQNATNAWFLDTIHKYFHFTHPNIYTGNTTHIYTIIKDLSIFPKSRKGKLQEASRYYYMLDLSNVYNERVLVNSCGGNMGRLPLQILKYIQLTPLVLDVYCERRKELPESYLGVHIRNTDRLSDVPAFLEENQKIMTDNVFFLASDHYDTIESIRTLYPTMMTFSTIPDNNGKNIHTESRHIDRQECIIDCIVDLMLLASATSLIYPNENSGYTRIAKYLFENKPILNKILLG